MQKFIFLFFISLFFFACKSYHGEQQQTQTAPAETQACAEKIITSYLPLKDALVKTDAQAAKKQAIALAEVAKTAASDIIISVQVLEIEKAAIALSETEDVEKQRLAFSTISHAAYNIAKMTGVMKGKLFQQFCPMAFNDKGDFWLSGEKQVMNPYFGDKMLHCGKVMEEL